MKVCIAEKPSVAKDIAKVLGATNRKDGYMEGNGYQVTWTFGHFCTLKEPHEYNANWKRWTLYDLPVIPDRFGIRLIDDSGVKKQFGIIEKLVGAATEVINCGDAGQEGELIQRWVLQKAACKCPVKRLWISSLTEDAIKEGFTKLKPESEFDQLYLAGMARAVGDWLLGINATRLYTLKYGRNRQLLSLGRVQTPTLALLVHRQQEIEGFKPSPYWELKTVYREVEFNATEGRYTDKEKAEAAMQEVANKPFEIDSMESKEGNDYAPRLFDLTSLQVDCNRKFGFTADKTLKLIQSLYEKKVATYPRVDTTYLSNDIYPKVPGILKGMRGYESFVAPLLKTKIRKSKKVFDDKKVTDHHAIIPTGVAPIGLSQDEMNVYDLIARRFLAAFYPDCKVMLTVVLGHAGSENFKATGKQILEPGWRVVIGTKDDKDDEQQLMPAFEKGESGSHKPTLQEKQTQPPKYFTEASLLRAMETAGKQMDDDTLREALKENGIGRPSTRASIIETLFRRKYILRDKRRILAAPTGVSLINTIRNELLKSAELTGLWEKKLRGIERGEYELQLFVGELKAMVQEVVDVVKNDHSGITIEAVEEASKVEQKSTKSAAPVEKQKCPKCESGEILKGKSAYGCSRWKEGCDFRIDFIQFGKKLSNKQFEQLFLKGKTNLIKGFSIEGEKKDGKLALESDGTITFLEKEEAAVVCQVCKSGEIIKGKTAYGCNNFRNGCRFRIPFEYGGKKISMELVRRLVAKGSSTLLKDVEMNGQKQDGYFIIDKNGQFGFKSV